MSAEEEGCGDEKDMNFSFTGIQSNGSGIPQMVSVMDGNGGVQYVQSQPQHQLITLPITLPGAKPGDPQQTVQIQVLNPNVVQQQQPKYQMQIPIQGFQHGGAVLTLAYTPDSSEGIQLGMANRLPDGIQIVGGVGQELPAQAHENGKEPPQATILIQAPQMLLQQQQQDKKQQQQQQQHLMHNNNNLPPPILMEGDIKQECDDTNDYDESSEHGTESGGEASWSSANDNDISTFLNTHNKQQKTLPVNLQQFLRLNSSVSAPATPSAGAVVVKQQPRLDDSDAYHDGEGDDAMPEEPSSNNEEDCKDKVKKKKKYKKKAVKAARPKPGQVVIATALDGTVIYCCPECHMAYPEKEELELHLAVHKIERRFICGICGAGLKRKEHLERHKLGHNPERPYVCAVCRKGFKRKEHLNLHAVIHSGEKTEVCLECGKGFYRKDHLRKHTRSHATRRAREMSLGVVVPAGVGGAGGVGGVGGPASPAVATPAKDAAPTTTIMPEITIHVPTSSNMQVPVQISVPQHIMSSLTSQPSITINGAASSQPAQAHAHTHHTLDELLAQHS